MDRLDALTFHDSNQDVSDHFHLEVQLIKAGKGARRRVEDYHLSRYARYLIVQNADPAKPIVALGQTYFAYQTRRQEINDELALANLPEDQKRLIFRSLMSTYNIRLAEAASYSYSSGRVSTYLRNHSKAFSQ